MKKIIYIFCILLLSLNLISCGNNEDNKEAVKADEQATEQNKATKTTKVKSGELKVDSFTTNDNYVKAKWVYGQLKESK